jgi:hypothetical protein
LPTPSIPLTLVSQALKNAMQHAQTTDKSDIAAMRAARVLRYLSPREIKFILLFLDSTGTRLPAQAGQTFPE